MNVVVCGIDLERRKREANVGFRRMPTAIIVSTVDGSISVTGRGGLTLLPCSLLQQAQQQQLFMLRKINMPPKSTIPGVCACVYVPVGTGAQNKRDEIQPVNKFSSDDTKCEVLRCRLA